MGSDEFAKLVTKIKAKYHETILEAEKKRDQELAAIRVVRKLLRGGTHGDFTKAIKKAIIDSSESFSVHQIKTDIEAVNIDSIKNRPMGDFSGCLARLERNGFIKIVTRGVGRAYNTYTYCGEQKKQN